MAAPIPLGLSLSKPGSRAATLSLAMSRARELGNASFTVCTLASPPMWKPFLVLASTVENDGASAGTVSPTEPLREITLNRRSDGHFYIDGLVNGDLVNDTTDT